MSGLSEFDLISTYFAPLAGPEALDLQDDAALFTPPAGYQLVISKDMLAADVHFFADDDPAQIAQKALRMTLSDLAAKGAKPLGYVLGLSLKAPVDADWLAAFSDGLAQDQNTYDVSLWGGDTIKADTLLVSVSGFGIVPQGCARHRNGAEIGDIIYLTGNLGDAALGFEVLRKKIPGHEALKRAYWLPNPPVKMHDVIARYAHASMDVSDGLFADLEHLIEASELGASVNLDQLPLSDAALKLIDAREDLYPLLFAGDDYQILFTAHGENADAIEQAFKVANVRVSRIGEITNKDTGLQLTRSGLPFDPAKLMAGGYRHF